MTRAKPEKAMTPAAIGFRAGRGGSIVVAVVVENCKPRVVLSAFLATAAEGDRLSREPYHVAAEMARAADGKVSAEAAAAVAEGRKRQAKLAATGLADIVRTLKESHCEAAMAALLVNRAGWIGDLLEYSLFAPEHPPVAEGLAVRDAIRIALARCAINTVELDEKSLPEVASKKLRLSIPDMDARLKSLAKPWRKEHKLACLAAWLALGAR